MKNESEFRLNKKPDLDNPVLIEGLPGIGYVGKLAVDHLVEELDAEKFGEMISPYFPHHVTVNSDGVLDLVKVNFYHAEIDGKDLVLLAGDVQATSSEGHYEVTNKILDLADHMGIDKIYALGGYATGKHSKSKPKVVGASNSDEVLEEYREKEIDIEEDSGPILGISGLLLGLGEKRDIAGYVLLGETHGMLVDHRSAQAVLESLENLLDFEVDLSKLDERAKKTEEILSRLRKEQKLREGPPGGEEAGEEDLSYIG